MSTTSGYPDPRQQSGAERKRQANYLRQAQRIRERTKDWRGFMTAAERAARAAELVDDVDDDMSTGAY